MSPTSRPRVAPLRPSPQNAHRLGIPEQLSLCIEGGGPANAHSQPLWNSAKRPNGHAVALPTGTDRILSTRQIVAITGHHRCTIYRWMQAGKFPQRHGYKGLTTGWRQSEITSWLAGDKSTERQSSA